MRSRVELHSEAAEKTVRAIRLATRRQYSAQEKVLTTPSPAKVGTNPVITFGVPII